MEVFNNTITKSQQRFWSPEIRTLSPYIPGEQSHSTEIIKLNTNENPYPPSPHVIDAITHALGQQADCLRLYPNSDAFPLRVTIAHQQGLSADQVFVGNGSDEVLAFIFKAFFIHPNQPILYPDISYSFYPVYTQFYQLQTKAIPVDQNFEIQVQDYVQENGGIIIANPNAPTGIALDLEQIKSLLESNPDRVVVIDEAYVDFGAESAVQLIADYENLVVCQTTSKSRSLAGLRIGYALAQPHLICALDRVKNSFNSFPVDHLAMVAAQASFHDQTYFEKICTQIIQNRKTLIQHMTTLGFNILPSKANFIFASHPEYSAKILAQQLKDQHILVRYFDKPRIENFLRISVGSAAENQVLIHTLKDIIG